MDKILKNLRTASVTTSTAKDVCETKQLTGEASNSLDGKNETVQYTTGSASMGALGGENKNN